VARRLKFAEIFAAAFAAGGFFLHSVPLLFVALALFGTVAGGWLMARLALAARRAAHRNSAAGNFAAAKLATARFYAEHYLARAPAYLPGIMGGATVVDFDPDLL